MNKTKIKSFLIITVIIIVSAIYLHNRTTAVTKKESQETLPQVNEVKTTTTNCSEEVNKVISNTNQSSEKPEQKEDLSCSFVKEK